MGCNSCLPSTALRMEQACLPSVGLNLTLSSVRLLAKVPIIVTKEFARGGSRRNCRRH